MPGALTLRQASKRDGSPNPSATIVNVVASTRVNGPLDLDLLANKLSPNSYEPKRFCALIYHRQGPKATLAIFSSGKITSTGSKSEREAQESIRTTVTEIVARVKKPMMTQNITTENIVATANLGQRINIERLSLLLRRCLYEPEQFPAIIYRLRGTMTLLIFNSGRLVCAGSKKEIEAKSAISDMHQIITHFGAFL